MDKALRDALDWIACEGACPISAAILTQRRGEWRDQGDFAVADWSGGEVLAYLSADRRLLSLQLRGDQRRASVSTNLPQSVVQRSAAH